LHFALGLQSARVAAAEKHFPGFGGATQNSDNGAAYIYRSADQLRTEDARPFADAASGGVLAMMVSHGMYVHLGGEVPASLNRRIATGRLRSEIGFKGVAISDSLSAVAWYAGSTQKACADAVGAGIDIALVTGSLSTAESCFKAIRAAVWAGAIPQARIDQAVRRVLNLKRWLGVYAPPG
jgi:beta-N-acetylhexosaminidase